MSLVVTKGYLLARYDYAIFDEVLVFLNQFGNRFTCLALGTRKITSKNARALLYGNYLEIELFYTHSNEKMSKLKKVVAINQIGFNYASNLALITAGDVISKLPNTNKMWFDFYQDILVKVLMDYDKYQISVYVYLVFIKVVFRHVKLQQCSKHLYQNKQELKLCFSFYNSTLVCTECSPQIKQLTSFEIQLLLTLNKFSLQDLDFFNKTYNINWKSFYLKLHYSFNEYRKKINQLYKK